MSNQKHTPGPWHIEGYLVSPKGRVGHIISHGINSYGDGPEGYVCKAEDTTDADARLIAAAPDLLEALKAIKELAKPGQSLGISDAIDLICDIYNVALKALPTGGDD